MFNGVNGPPNGAGPTCGVTVSVCLAATAIGDDPVAGAARVTARTSGLGFVFVNPNVLGDCSVDSAFIEFSCGIEDVAAGDDVLCDDVFRGPSPTFPGADAFTATWPVTMLEAPP
jgi:hypothetical protein